MEVGKLNNLISVNELAEWLRTTPRAVYSMRARGQLPDPVRVGRRLLYRKEDLLGWLGEKCAVSPRETRR
ncbi:MAG: helix-turn-helix domain-containing protein [Myxococcales bacterium]|nr:helix-turn-helix domain-containing protein [Myxococcales bacterium]